MMMKYFFSVLINLLISFSVFSQSKTKVIINIAQVDTSKLNAQIVIEDPLQPINTDFYRDTVEIKDGRCQFTFDIVHPCFMTLFINEKYVTMPGAYSVIVEPGDNLVFNLPPINEAGYYGFGILNTNISGKGSDKINLTKNMVNKCFEIYKKDPDYQLQSLNYKFQTTDEKLSIIDSLYNNDKSVSVRIKDIIKAQLYGQQFEGLFRSCKRSESDSLRFLFDKYIVNKNRMEVFYKKDIVQYGGTIGSYLILSEFKNPVKVDGEFFQKKHKMDYAKLIAKRLSKFPDIRDYLMSNHLLSSILSGLDTTTVQLYEFYLKNTDFNNPNYINVVTTYEEIQRKLSVGKPFYDFALPDSTGKIFKLSDFRGQVLVFDFWFNGCGGCKTMVPYLMEVEQKLKDKNVKFISIGIDKKEFWLKGIGKYSSSNSLQLFTSNQEEKHPMIQYLNIHSYPRLIIVDKNGKMLSAPPDPRSNTTRFINIVESYL